MDEAAQRAEMANENLPPLPQGGGNLPSIEELLGALDKLDLPESDKESLRETLMGRGSLNEDSFKNMFQKPAGMGVIPENNPFMFYTFVLSVIIVLTLFVFFGYKLYKSLVDKQKQRELKRLRKESRRRK